MKIIAFIPAKGHSERIANKNLRILDGEYLFKRKLRQALACPLIDEVYLDTESDELAALATDVPVSALASRKSRQQRDGRTRDVRLGMQPGAGCRFLYPGALHRALVIGGHADLVPSRRCWTIRGRQPRWRHPRQAILLGDGQEPLYGPGRIPNSVDLPATVVEAMSLYIVRRAPGAPPTRRFGARPILFDLDPQEQVDVNMPADLEFAETICGRPAACDVQQSPARMRAHLSSTILADICKEMGMRVVLPPKIRPMMTGRQDAGPRQDAGIGGAAGGIRLSQGG